MASDLLNYLLCRAEMEFGEALNPYIIDRLSHECDVFSKYHLEMIVEKHDELEEKDILNQNLFTARSSACNSLIIYLLGFSNINPLKRHFYNKITKEVSFKPVSSDPNDICVAPDDYDLPFELFENDLKRKGSKSITIFSNIADSSRMNDLDILFSIKHSMYHEIAHSLGITTKNTKKSCGDIQDICSFLDEELADNRLYKKHLIQHGTFVGVPILKNEWMRFTKNKFWLSCFSDLLIAWCMGCGRGVLEASYKLFPDPALKMHDIPVTRDQIYNALLEKGLQINDILKICGEIRKNVDGNLSDESVGILKRARVQNKFIEFLKNIKYVFHTGAAASELRLSVEVAKHYLYSPIDYYAKSLISHKVTKEDFDAKTIVDKYSNEKDNITKEKYLLIIDLIEREIDINKLMEYMKENNYAI